MGLRQTASKHIPPASASAPTLQGAPGPSRQRPTAHPLAIACQWLTVTGDCPWHGHPIPDLRLHVPSGTRTERVFKRGIHAKRHQAKPVRLVQCGDDLRCTRRFRERFHGQSRARECQSGRFHQSIDLQFGPFGRNGEPKFCTRRWKANGASSRENATRHWWPTPRTPSAHPIWPRTYPDK